MAKETRSTEVLTTVEEVMLRADRCDFLNLCMSNKYYK